MFSKKISKLVMAFYACIIITLAGCGDKEPKTNPEDPLRISLDASSMVITPGPEYDLKVNVLSTMPPEGVQIAIEVKGELNGVVYFSSPFIQSTEKSTAIKLTYLPRQVICVCNVKVTSKGNATNKTETSFKLAYK